jgi:hypothetical protein
MRHVRVRPQFRETRAGAYDWFPYRCASHARPERSSPRRPFRPCWPRGGCRALLWPLWRGRVARVAQCPLSDTKSCLWAAGQVRPAQCHERGNRIRRLRPRSDSGKSDRLFTGYLPIDRASVSTRRRHRLMYYRVRAAKRGHTEWRRTIGVKWKKRGRDWCSAA